MQSYLLYKNRIVVLKGWKMSPINTDTRVVLRELINIYALILFFQCLFSWTSWGGGGGRQGRGLTEKIQQIDNALTKVLNLWRIFLVITSKH